MESRIEKVGFDTAAKPNWCPGCGNFGILSGLKKAFVNLGLEPHQIAMATGIGCSSKITHWVNTYGFHGLHGRSLPIAAGIKLANSDLCVIAEGGDGDGFSEGMNHFMQACRRNIDMTYIVHDNGVFSLTTGQTSATSEKGFISNTTPDGAIEPPHNPIALAITAGATFVARGFSGDIKQLTDLVTAAVKHRGFAFIDVMQVCVSYNPAKSFKWYKERVYKLEDEGHDPNDKSKALSAAFSCDGDRLATGLFFVNNNPPYEDSLPQIRKAPLVKHDLSSSEIDSLMKDLI